MTDYPDNGFEVGSADEGLADHLRMERPIPSARFRGNLRRELAENDPGYGPRPECLRLMVAGYLGAGGLLIALAALGVS